MNLAKAYASAGQYDSAKTSFIEILQKDKENWESYLELAKVCIALKETEKAEGYLVTLQEKNPTYRASEVASLLQSIK